MPKPKTTRPSKSSRTERQARKRGIPRPPHPPPKCKKERPNQSYKLGQIAEQPDGKHSLFSMDMRMPGWHPDADVVPDPDKADAYIAKPLFSEEALHCINNSYIPFPVPGHRVIGQGGAVRKVPFAEPPGKASDADWRNFNKWILGGPIPDP